MQVCVYWWEYCRQLRWRISISVPELYFANKNTPKNKNNYVYSPMSNNFDTLIKTEHNLIPIHGHLWTLSELTEFRTRHIHVLQLLPSVEQGIEAPESVAGWSVGELSAGHVHVFIPCKKRKRRNVGGLDYEARSCGHSSPDSGKHPEDRVRYTMKRARLYLVVGTYRITTSRDGL